MVKLMIIFHKIVYIEFENLTKASSKQIKIIGPKKIIVYFLNWYSVGFLTFLNLWQILTFALNFSKITLDYDV